MKGSIRAAKAVLENLPLTRAKTVALLAAAMAIALSAMVAPAQAQSQPANGSGPGGNQTGGSSGQSQPTGIAASIAPGAEAQFESSPILSLPKMFARQWMFRSDSLPVDQFAASEDNLTQKVTLKEAVFLGLRNNPGLGSVALDPIAATASVKSANAVFDPQLSSQIDVEKEVSPVGSPFQNPGSVANVQKFYDWNFGVSKVLPLSNGTLGLTFNNDRELTNTEFSPVNPVWTPTVVMSLSQPLLQNFGWQFATINVRLAESAQRSSQWNYASSLNDFVQRIGNDYWGVVQAQENLEVAQAALKFNNDLVRVNRASVRIGMMAPVNLTEALSAASTARANVEAAQAGLGIAVTTLRQDVGLNPDSAVLAREIEPVQRPDLSPAPEESQSDKTAFDQMLNYSPALAGMRESIRSALIQVKYSENQTLPQLNLGAQFGVTTANTLTSCIATVSSS